MKRISTLMLALVVAFSVAACQSAPASSTAPESKMTSSASASQPISAAEEGLPAGTTARVAALKGPTAMGMVKLMDDTQSKTPPAYEFSILGSVDEITPKLVQGELDIAAVPGNLGSVLYNNTKGAVRVLAIHTLGVLYIVENGDTVQSVEDLRGKTIYASGKGATPEYALNYMLEQSGIDPVADVTIQWKSEHSECVAALAADPTGIAMLPQPFVTTAQSKNEKLRVALDMNAQWEKLVGEAETPSSLITGVLVARSEFIDQNPQLVEQFLKEYEASIQYVNSHVDDAAALIEKYDIVPAAVAKKALPQCNITYIAGEEMKTKLSGYLQILYDQNPKAIGGTMPGEDFYYLG